MDPTVKKLWQDIVRCKLLTLDESREISSQQKLSESEPTSARQLAELLVAERHITPYHAKSLLAGHVGPFIFGDYRVNDRLPGGGKTRRFCGVHLPTKHKVILHFSSNPDEITDDQWAAKCDYFCRHRAVVDPHLDRCYETITRTTHKIAITENVKGQSAADLLEKQKRVPVPLACDIVRQAACGLQTLANAGLIHCHIQPDRIVVQKTGHVRLLRDPTHLPTAVDLSAPDAKGYLRDRANYLAPELMNPTRRLDTRTDIYALGCTLFELLVGHVPFAGGSAQEKMVRHSQEPIISLVDAIGAPADLAEVVTHMLAKNYNVRFESADQVVAALSPFCSDVDDDRTPQFRSSEIRFCEDLRVRLQGIRSAQQEDPSDASPAVRSPVPVNQPSEPATDLDNSKTSSPAARSIIERRKTGNLWIKIACFIAAVAAIATIGLFLNHLVSPAAPTPETAIAQANDSTADDVEAPADEGSANDVDQTSASLVENDATALWQSPTFGTAIPIDFLPAGIQFFGSVDMTGLLASFEGRRALKALGPEFATWRKQWQAETNIRLDQIHSIVFANVAQDVGVPKSVFVIRMPNREPIDELIQQNHTQPVTNGRLWSLNGRSFYAADGQPLIVVGSPELVSEIANTGGKAPLLRQDLELLRSESDFNRHFNLITTKNFVAADGRTIISEARKRARKAIVELMGEDTKASSASLHFADNAFYAEFRVAGPNSASPHQIVKSLRDRVDTIPNSLTEFLGTAVVEPYWQRLALQVPTMSRFLVQHVRYEPTKAQAIANVVLPPQAAHNLVLVGEIVSIAGANDGATTASPKTYTHASILELKLSSNFGQQSLEFAIRDLAELANEQYPGANLRIQILGGDLELDGITRNQQIKNSNEVDVTIAEILTSLVRQANP
ncbi:MAG: protein kinase, partial [Planctomycetales bacterium]|nr:protein kinase [Planctomycetales bacterium]